VTLIKRLRDVGLVLPSIFAVGALGVLLALGTWQLNRKVWKDQLLQTIAARQTAPPISLRVALTRAAPSIDAVDYQRVRVRGTFDHSTERHVYAPRNAGSGWHVYTLLTPEDGDAPVFVNRGWVSEAVKDPLARAASQLAGAVEINGLIRKPEAKATFTPDNDYKNNRWYSRDIDAMRWGTSGPPSAAALATMKLRPYAPFAIDADAKPENPGGWPQGGVTYVALSNRHLEYAGTWYGLAFTLVGVFFVFVRGRLRTAV
jgi:surfeit locus 1 family protein